MVTVGTVGGGAQVVVVTVVVVAIALVVVFTDVDGGSLGVTVTTGLARVVWISALLARASLSRSRISSICSCSSSSSPGRGGATTAGGVGGAAVLMTGATVRVRAEAFVRIEAVEVDEAVADVFEGNDSTRLARDGAGPPFSHSLPIGPTFNFTDGSALGGPSPLATAALASDAARRASRRRVLRVSRWKWTRLKSLASIDAAVASSLGISLFHFAAAPGAGDAGVPGGGWDFSRLQLKRQDDTKHYCMSKKQRVIF